MISKEKRRVVITGMSVLSGAGNNINEFYSNLRAGKTGIRECTVFSGEKLRSPLCGEIDMPLPYRTRKQEEITRFTAIANVAMADLLSDSNLDRDYLEALMDRCILSAATSVGANAHLIEYVQGSMNGIFSPDWLTYFPEFIIKTFADICHIRGAYYINTSACAAGTTAAGAAFSMVRNGDADIAIVAGIEPLTEFSCYGFNSLQNTSLDICRPFDLDSTGITVGEAGAALVFEDYEHAVSRNAKIYCEVMGYGLSNDAYHITSPDPAGGGAVRAIRMALEDGNVSPCMVDYVNAHGTGTEQNDEMEIKALENIFKDVERPVYVNSSKAVFGHCLAAAGAIELVVTVLSIIHDEVFPTATLKNPRCSSDKLVFPMALSESMPINYALSNSFAFAGNTASILVGKLRHPCNNEV